MDAKQSENGVARLVTFLGLGRFDRTSGRFRYDTTIYNFLGRSASTTPFVCRGLADLLRPSEVLVLATQEAEDLHGEELKEALRAGGHPEARIERIPHGKHGAESWKQFEVIKTALRGAAGPVMLDITNGFRSQPFFAAAVAAFVRAVDEKPPELRICYAAYDARDESNVAPIWELTEFVTLLDWSYALATFLRTGRAGRAGEETQRLGRDLRKAWARGGMIGETPNLTELGGALKRFGGDLETLRTGDLLLGREGAKSSADDLLEAARATLRHAGAHAPPLLDVLGRVMEMVEPLAGVGPNLSGDDGRKAVAALAGLYFRLGRYLEAVATIREGWVNFYSCEEALVPGAANFDPKRREEAENDAAKFDKTFREVADRRNDLLHAQYRRSAQRADNLIGTVENLVEKLRRQGEGSTTDSEPKVEAQ